MYSIIDFITNKEKAIEQVKLQNALGFDGYFQKQMIQDIPYYQRNRYNQKASLQIITPQQSIFTLVQDSHERTCNTLLGLIYGKDFQVMDDPNVYRYRNEDEKNNRRLGNIYIKELDSDISMKKSIFPSTQRHVLIFVPKNFNMYQFEELKRSIDTIKKYDKKFLSPDIVLAHYLNDINENDNNYEAYDKRKIDRFLKEDALKYIREVPINPDEQILVDTCREATSTNPRQSVTFVERVNIEPVAVANNNSSMQENRGNAINNDYTAPGETGTPRE